MYLKRLEIHGFKSFASPTKFEFGTGATCVIGPNGSGKTNVAEAIRWVLGEHASRVIRARKTEDVIFSGSAKRNALGMAEVRLTLDNSEGWLPLDFSEVVVSRRAYRSGENEYYINNSRVRLKDVTDLFLKAQIGQNSYAFMGQGLVDEVLTLRPEERRSLIEEAADVKLHRTKLDEARNRLSATKDNLERVRMLVREIEPRLRQLERQADRAATYKRLSAELAESLTILFSQQWQDAQEALAAAQVALEQREEDLTRARADVQACEEGLTALAAAIDERRHDIDARIEAQRRLDDYCADLTRRITMDEERVAMLTARREELQREIDALATEQEELSGLLRQQEARVREVERQIEAAGASPEDSDEARRVDERLASLREALATAERKAAEARVHAAESESRIESLTERKAGLERELALFDRERAGQLAPLKSWARDFALRRQRHLELSAAFRRAEQALTEAERRFTALSDSVATRREELRALTVEIDSAQMRLDAAQGADVELPAPDEGVRAVLAAGGKMADIEPPEDSRVHGVIAVLGQLIRVPAGLERAIEAALADSLHAIVVETDEDALAAVEVLISEDAGRATVLPLRDIRPTSPLNLLEERGVLGVASELVRCEARYRPLINLLLGRTIVAENLGTAKKILRRGMGNVVTLDGILLQTSGAMTAGSARAIRRALAHQRDVGELPEELRRLRAAQQETQTALERDEQALEQAKGARDAALGELQRLRSEASSAEEALRRHRSRLPGLAVRLSSLHVRRREAQRALREIDGDTQRARDAGEEARRQATAAAQDLDALRTQIEEVTRTHEATLRRAAEHAARIGGLETELAGLRELEERQRASLTRVERDLQQRNAALSQIAEELHTVESRLGAARRELDEKQEEARSKAEDLEPARNSIEQLESRQRAIQQELEVARSRALEAERALLDAQANLRLRHEEIEVLRERLEEEGFRPAPDGEGWQVQQQTESEDGPPQWLTIDASRGGGGPPPVAGGATVDVAALRDRVHELRTEIRKLGPVNEQAAADYAESKERYEFLSTQLNDLTEAEAQLQDAIQELERIIRERFSTTFRTVNEQFKRYFETFFGGGHAELVLTRTDDDAPPGVDIIAQPPRKRVRTINMLSGGERSLTAVALLFALLATHPSPICVLDEVDAALDEANVGRFTNALRELAERTQFIIVTHNRRTIEIADTIYGISMGEDSASSVLSLRLSDVPVN